MIDSRHIGDMRFLSKLFERYGCKSTSLGILTPSGHPTNTGPPSFTASRTDHCWIFQSFCRRNRGKRFIQSIKFAVEQGTDFLQLVQYRPVVGKLGHCHQIICGKHIEHIRQKLGEWGLLGLCGRRDFLSDNVYFLCNPDILERYLYCFVSMNEQCPRTGVNQGEPLLHRKLLSKEAIAIK